MGTGIRSDPSTGNSPLISLGSTLHLVSTPTELCLHPSWLHLHPNVSFAFATLVTALDSPRTSSPTHQTPSYISPPPTGRHPPPRLSLSSLSPTRPTPSVCLHHRPLDLCLHAHAPRALLPVCAARRTHFHKRAEESTKNSKGRRRGDFS